MTSQLADIIHGVFNLLALSLLLSPAGRYRSRRQFLRVPSDITFLLCIELSPKMLMIRRVKNRYNSARREMERRYITSLPTYSYVRKEKRRVSNPRKATDVSEVPILEEVTNSPPGSATAISVV